MLHVHVDLKAFPFYKFEIYLSLLKKKSNVIFSLKNTEETGRFLLLSF